jgi:hypothetical protein
MKETALFLRLDRRALLQSGHPLARLAAVHMVAQDRISPGVVRLESTEFVVQFLSAPARLANLSALLVPNLAGGLALFQETLITGANRRFDGQFSVHFDPPIHDDYESILLAI